jgi:hypothetical protein
MSKSRPSKSRAAILPTPDFAWDPTTRPPIAGLRPYRERTYRLEPEVVGSKFVVHNYGHGGAGITLSWGCAHEVVDQRPIPTIFSKREWTSRACLQDMNPCSERISLRP